MFDVLILALDILMASCLAAILTRFATAARFAQSIAAVSQQHRRFAGGILLFVPSLVLSLPALLMQGSASPAVLDAVNAAGYPFSYVGAYLVYAATLEPHETPSEGSSW